MKRCDIGKTSRRQAEADILRNMRLILSRLDERERPSQSETIDRGHVLSIVSHYTALKRGIRF